MVGGAQDRCATVALQLPLPEMLRFQCCCRRCRCCCCRSLCCCQTGASAPACDGLLAALLRRVVAVQEARQRGKAAPDWEGPEWM